MAFENKTLGELLDETENKRLELLAPYLVPKASYVHWDGYWTLGEKK